MASDKTAAIKSTHDQSGGIGEAREKRTGMTTFEKIMAVLTLSGVVIAVLTGGIFWKQFGAMKTDQRAWVNVTLGQAKFVTDAAGGVSVNNVATVVNTGKTPAKQYVLEIVLDYLPKDKELTFTYKTPRVIQGMGIIFPNNPDAFRIDLLRDNPSDPNVPETRILSPAEYKDFQQGNAFIVTYGRSTYVDIFGTPHRYQFCNFLETPIKPERSGYGKCAYYNDVDND